MLSWFQENANLLSMLSSFAMLVVWLLYLQLFYQSFKRQRQPNLLIHQANGFDLGSLCMIANMSVSNVHIAALLVDASRGDAAVTFRPAPMASDPLEADDPLRNAHVGPLAQGGYHTVGTFRTLVAEAEARLAESDDAGSTDTEDEDVLQLTVRIVAFVGPELHPIGARRTFEITSAGGVVDVRARFMLPEQLSSRRQRRIAARWLEEAQALDSARVATYEEEEQNVERLIERRKRIAADEAERRERNQDSG